MILYFFIYIYIYIYFSRVMFERSVNSVLGYQVHGVPPLGRLDLR